MASRSAPKISQQFQILLSAPESPIKRKYVGTVLCKCFLSPSENSLYFVFCQIRTAVADYGIIFDKSRNYAFKYGAQIMGSH